MVIYPRQHHTEYKKCVVAILSNLILLIMSTTTHEGERLHSTVRLNQFSLQFEDPVLEKTYQAELHPRKKALWLRSLLPAAASQLLFALADGLDFPIENLLLTVPTRVLLAVRWFSLRVSSFRRSSCLIKDSL